MYNRWRKDYLALNPLEKIINNLSTRLERFSPSNERIRQDMMMERKFAKLREERAKNYGLPGLKADEYAWTHASQEEIDYYRSKRTPEQRYREMKEMYYFHDSSSYMRFGDNRTQNDGCNADTCIPECDFYREFGRIEDDGTITH